MHVPFPFDDAAADSAPSAFAAHPAVVCLRERLGLASLVGYVTLVRVARAADAARSDGDAAEERVEEVDAYAAAAMATPKRRPATVG